MQIRVGLENNIEGRTLGWALDYPGCFAYGHDEAEALIRMPRALLTYEIWIKDHTQSPWVNFNDLDLRVVEQFETFRLGKDYKLAPEGQGYEINAWFKDDWQPLSSEEIKQGLIIFHWQREELLAGISTLDSEILKKEHPNERWNIWGIVNHIANAELYYLSRLELTELNVNALSPDPVTRLAQTAALIDEIFPKFINIVNVTGMDGEFWSYRKILRRILWHQRDHINHIKQLAFNAS